MTTKTCTKCGETKATTEFYKNKGNKDGIRNDCKCCKNKTVATWQEANPEKRALLNRAWRNSNKEKVDAYVAAWQKANPAHHSAVKGRSGAMERSPLGGACVPSDFDMHATIPIYAERIRLTKETGVVHHVDHIIPLAAGGLHEASNLQVLTASENTAKGANE